MRTNSASVSVPPYPACIESIFPDDVKSLLADRRDTLEVFPGYVQTRTFREHELSFGPHNMEKMKASVIGPEPFSITLPKASSSPRGLIVSFSRKSKSRMIKRMHSLKIMPNFWQDFTFPDAVFAGLPFDQYSKRSTDIMESFKVKVSREFPELSGIWRREWQDRKSGDLVGSLLPHYHVLLIMPGSSESDFRSVSVRLAVLWVESLPVGSEDRAKAMKVAISPKSYRWIHSPKMASCYVSKYVAKEENHDREGVSLGRFWGVIGNPPFSEPEVIRLHRSEMVLLKRIFRRLVRGLKNKRLFNTFKQENFNTWLLLPSSVVLNIVSHISRVLPPVPF